VNALAMSKRNYGFCKANPIERAVLERRLHASRDERRRPEPRPPGSAKCAARLLPTPTKQRPP
jgi:hypothetical protein